MFAPAHEKEADSTSGRDLATLELTVNNHPGVMSHICGLFARRAFNLAGILCMPLTGNGRSRIWLLVEDGARIDQIVNQVAKLEDVLEVQNRPPDKDAFLELECMFTHATPEG